MGSNYLTVEGSPMNSSSSPDSLNGLKFGQKIYFEDVGIGASTKSSNGSSSSSSSSQPKKSGKGLLQNGQPPRCQVEGCKLDLSDAKTYYSRHKVCAMHSKSPKVVVAGIEQRFCQQCSRFHQLSEFDQGKRSCRRRLAGHNERRRKPPPGSLLSSRLGRLSSSLFGGNTSRNGGFLLDFSSYSRNSGKGPWPDTKPHEPGSHSTFNGKYLHNMWPAGNTGDPPEMFLQGSVGLSGFPIPPGECITGGVSSDSSCALSLLSNQTWGSRNRASGIELGNLMNLDGAAMSQCTEAHTVTVAPIPSSSSGNSSSSSWGFKTHDSNAGLQMMPPDHLGLGQISVSQAHGGQFPSDLFIDQVHDGGRQYMEVDHSRAYNSVTNSHVHWSLS